MIKCGPLTHFNVSTACFDDINYLKYRKSVCYGESDQNGFVNLCLPVATKYILAFDTFTLIDVNETKHGARDK